MSCVVNNSDSVLRFYKVENLISKRYDSCQREEVSCNDGDSVLFGAFIGAGFHIGTMAAGSLAEEAPRCMAMRYNGSQIEEIDFSREMEYCSYIRTAALAAFVMGPVLGFCTAYCMHKFRAWSQIHEAREHNQRREKLQGLFSNIEGKGLLQPLDNKSLLLLFENTKHNEWLQFTPHLSDLQKYHLSSCGSEKVQEYLKTQKLFTELSREEENTAVQLLGEKCERENIFWEALETTLQGSGNGEKYREVITEALNYFEHNSITEGRSMLCKFLWTKLTIDNVQMAQKIEDRDIQELCRKYYKDHKSTIDESKFFNG